MGRCRAVELAGPRVALRELQPSDVEAVGRYAGDRRVTRYLVWGPNTPAETSAHLEAAMSEARSTPRTDYQLGVVALDAGDLIGAARLSLDSDLNRRGQIGYVLRRDRWGRGLATETVHLLLHLGFRQLGLHHMRATCHPDNVASARVLEKVGMSLDGRIRDHMLIRGAWRDSLMYSLLAPEWIPPAWLALGGTSGDGELVMRQATRNHLGDVIAILSEAAGWLAARGIDQWPVPFPDSWVVEGIEAGEVYLAYRGALAAATITLQWSDPVFWPDLDDGEAAYVHRLAVRRPAAGRGVGHRLLAWAEERAAEAGRGWLRLDCVAGNSRLRAWYGDAGFSYCGDTEGEGWRVSRYQRPVGQTVGH